MKCFKKNSLLFVVFLTGACVLVIEVVATRILSPFFGNTIFTTSSVISIVLAALSVGYYIGGKLADKYPTEKMFYSIIFLSGPFVLLIFILNLFLLPQLGYKLSIAYGPIISSVLLFFMPSLILGTLSPFAIKLQEKYLPDEGIGGISGGIFFWSTLGSIFGSLSAGFILIPFFGINQIVLFIALVLSVLGALPLIKVGSFRKSIVVAIGIVLIFGFFLVKHATHSKSDNLLYEKDGVYEKIVIYDGKFNNRPVRFFQQDRSDSGAMYLDSDELVYDYTKYYSIYPIFKKDIKQALVIGGGAYSIPKALLADLPEVTVDVSEIEPELYNLGKKYFRVPDSPRLKNYTEDGRRLLYDTDKRYDLIFSDVYYSLFSIPTNFTTKEFFAIAKNKLSDDGIFVANFIGSLSHQKPSLILSEIRTFQEVFSNSYFFAVKSPGTLDAQNIIFVGYNSDKKINFNDESISKSNNETIKNLPDKLLDTSGFNLSSFPLLTDNHSPVEYLTSKLLQKRFYGSGNFINGEEMMALIDQQLSYGPRFLGSGGHEKVQNFILSKIKTYTKDVEIQKWEYGGINGDKNKMMNIIGSFYPDKPKRVILAAHYDSKKKANLDKEYPDMPVPGANDSASGVAVLLDIARYLVDSNEEPNIGVDLIFFDGEEGDPNMEDGSRWQALGSKYFVENLNQIYPQNKPYGGIVIDLVCDKDLKIGIEKSSIKNARLQTEKFFEIAKKTYPQNFESAISAEIMDDHTSLNKAGIPSFLVIDFNYPSFHTTKDTLDKCSAQSLATVGDVLLRYIYSE